MNQLSNNILAKPVYLFLLRWVALGLFIQLAGLCLITDGSRYANNVYLGLFLPSLVLSVFAVRDLPIWRQASTWIFLSVLGWAVVVAVFHPGTVGSLGRWLKVFALIALYVAAVAHLVGQERLFNLVLTGFVAVAAVCAWGSIFNSLDFNDLAKSIRGLRLSNWGWLGLADFKNPIVSAFYYGVALSIAVFLGISSRTVWARAAFAFAIVGLALYLFLTFSRGVWGAAVVSVAILVLFKRPKLLLPSILILIAVSVAISLCVPDGYLSLGRGLSYRDAIWQQWLTELHGFWLYGAGAGAEFETCLTAANRCLNQAHSLYLQFFYEFGITGICLLMLLCLSLIVKGWRVRHHVYAPLGLSLLSFALVASIANFYDVFPRPGVYWVVFWLPVGILIGLPLPQIKSREVNA